MCVKTHRQCLLCTKNGNFCTLKVMCCPVRREQGWFFEQKGNICRWTSSRLASEEAHSFRFWRRCHKSGLPPGIKKISLWHNQQSERQHCHGPLRLSCIPPYSVEGVGNFNFFQLIWYSIKKSGFALPFSLVNSMKISCFPPSLPKQKDFFLQQELRGQSSGDLAARKLLFVW